MFPARIRSFKWSNIFRSPEQTTTIKTDQEIRETKEKKIIDTFNKKVKSVVKIDITEEKVFPYTNWIYENSKGNVVYGGSDGKYCYFGFEDINDVLYFKIVHSSIIVEEK